ncbi:MAG: hypothetical protein MUP14_02410 [Dehalococcoidia bacterium]|nr:hypothetical protein [Dehalococcoidia bacterium]
MITTYRERQRTKAQALAEAEKALLRATHEANAKHNARLKAQGVGGRFECPPACYLCHPDAPTAPAGGPRLGTVDLRGRVAPGVLRGKRGRCQTCGASYRQKGAQITRRGWYCAACLVRRERREGRS